MFTKLAVSFIVFVGAAGSAQAQEAQQQAVTPLDLVMLKDIGGHHRGTLSVSPDGRRVAFQLQEPLLEENTYRLTWISVDSTGARRSLGDGGELILNPSKRYSTNGNRPEVKAVWAPDSESIFFLKKEDGDVQIWRGWVATGEQGQLTDGPADVMDVSLSADGRHLVYSVSRPRGLAHQERIEEGKRGYLFDDRFRTWLGPYPSRRWCGPGWADAVSLERECNPDVWTYDLVTGRQRVLAEHERERFRGASPTASWKGQARFRMATPAPDGQRVAWAQADDPQTDGALRPMLRVFAGRDPERAIACRGADACVGQFFDGLWWSESGNELFLLKRDRSAGRYAIYGWTPETNRVRTVLDTEDMIAACERAGAEAICLREAATQPREIVAIDLGSGSVRTLYDPNPEFRQKAFTRVRAMRWQDDFGNPVFGRLVYPRGYAPGTRYPLVVMPYGQPGFLRGDVGDEYPIHVLADGGFMALNIMHSGLPEWAKLSADEALIFGRWHNRRRKAYFSALANIIDQLEAEGLIDPSRVGMTGLSDAAQQVHYAVINSKLIAAGSMSSIVTPEHWYAMEVPRVREHLRNWFGGARSDSVETYRELSYRLNADRIEAALLVNVSDQEFPLGIPDFTALQDDGAALEVHVYPDEHHIKWRPQHRLSIYRRNVQWFRFWLQGVEDPMPVDPEQYVRWRALRAQRDAIHDAG